MHRLIDEDIQIEGLTARPLSVALIEPFVIATGRVDATRAVEIEVRLARGAARATGLGEAACLPPVTREDQPDVLAAIERVASALPSRPRFEALCAELGPVARAGLQTALADAASTLAGLPLRTWLGGPPGPAHLETDVTVAIAAPAKMAELARDWVARGFRALKVKVARTWARTSSRSRPSARQPPRRGCGSTPTPATTRARPSSWRGHASGWVCTSSAGAAVPDGRFRREWPRCRLPSRPPARIADESVKTLADVELLVKRRYADGINLKLAKTQPARVRRDGRRAREAGLCVMVGGMVETRLGMTAAAHVACAVGGVDFVDLDTAWLLADDPYVEAVRSRRAAVRDAGAAGLGIRRR